MLPDASAGLDAWPPVSAIRVGDWKYIWRSLGFAGWKIPAEQGGEQGGGFPSDVQNQLFNLASDPLEKENLVDVEPEIAEMLLKKLIDTYEGMGAAGNFSYPPNSPDALPENHGGVWEDGWC